MRKVTQHADEEGLVNQLVALRVHQVELERQAAPLLSLLMAVVQQACRDRRQPQGQRSSAQPGAGSRGQ